MGSNFDFTDKTQETLAAAIQLAKDYANAHGMHSRFTSLNALPSDNSQQWSRLISHSSS